MYKLIAGAVGLIAVIGAAFGVHKYLDNRYVLKDELQHIAAVGKSIILTSQNCDDLGKGWQPYVHISGRFPIGAGTTITADERNERREFKLLETGGEYMHVLTEPEMPSHTHDYGDRTQRDPNIGDSGSKIGDTQVQDDRKTGPRGRDMAHNNMPPYLVLNFCYRP